MSSSEASRRRAVFAQLEAIANDTPVFPDEQDAAEYNLLVDEVISFGYEEARDFKIEPGDFVPKPGPGNTRTGPTTREGTMLRHHVLDRKVKGLLRFVKLTNDGTIVDFNF